MTSLMEGTNVEGFEKTSSFLPPKHTPSFCASHVNKLTCLVLPLTTPNFGDITKSFIGKRDVGVSRFRTM